MSSNLAQTTLGTVATVQRNADPLATRVPGLEAHALSSRAIAAQRPREPAQRAFLLQAMEQLGIDRFELAKRLCVGTAVIDGWLEGSVAADGFRELEPGDMGVGERTIAGRSGRWIGFWSPKAVFDPGRQRGPLREKKPASRS
jgi:hypothetical protein